MPVTISPFANLLLTPLNYVTNLIPSFSSDYPDTQLAEAATMQAGKESQMVAQMPLNRPSPSQILRDQLHAAIVTGLPGGDDSSPTRNNSPDILLPNSPGDVSLSPSLDGSMVTSTPYPHKFMASLKPSDDNPFHTPSNTDSSDRSLTTPSTGAHSASSMEIFLGPQPLPFIRNRHRRLSEEYDPSPTRSKSDSSSGSIAIKMSSPVQLKVSNWRAEQMKKFKAVRPVQGARERPIPLLHGPLSLPYARNPSGVDATVADTDGYLSNVYGLRMAPSPEKDPRRVVSDTTARTASSASYMTAASHMSSRPSVVRDYNQVIGIKKDEANPFITEFNPKTVNLRALGLGKPAVSTATAVQDDAIHSASGVLWRSQPVDRLTSEFKTLTLLDPTTNHVYTVRVPKSETGERAVSVELVSSKYNSKADASVNWRSKEECSPGSAPPPPNNTPMGQQYNDRGVLTVEHLYEKFGRQKEVIDHMTQSLKSTDSPSSKSLSDNTSRKVSIQTPSATNSAEKKKRGKSRKDSTRPRGTPGSGKHLKRPVSEDEDKQTEKAAAPRTPRKSRAKGPSPTPGRVAKSSKA